MARQGLTDVEMDTASLSKRGRSFSLDGVTLEEGDTLTIMWLGTGSNLNQRHLMKGIDNLIIQGFFEQVSFVFDDNAATSTPLGLQVGTALQEVFDNGGNALTTELQTLNNSDLTPAYEQLAGPNIPATHQVVNISANEFMGTISNRIRSASHTKSAFSPEGLQFADSLENLAMNGFMPLLTEHSYGVWGEGFGALGDREEINNTSGYTYQIRGGSFGMDYQFSREWLLGITFGFAKTELDISASQDNTDIDSTYVGIYGSYDVPEWYLDWAVAYSWNTYDSKRHINIGAIGETAEGDYEGDQIAGFLEFGLNFSSDEWLVQPFAGFGFIHESQNSYNESGAPSSNLHVESSSLDSYKGSLGAKISREIVSDPEGLTLTTELRGRWIHEFGDTSALINSNFVGFSKSFTVVDEDLSRNSGALGVGLMAELTDNILLSFDYHYTLNQDLEQHFISGNLSYRW